MEKNNTVTYDWLACTVKPRYENPTSSVKFVIENLLQLKFEDFVLNQYGINRYSYHYALADIKVYFSLVEPNIISEKMGVFIELRGTGCRQYEEYMDGEFNNWVELFIRLASEDAHFTRIDIANDVYDKSLNVQRIYQYCKEQCCISRSKNYSYYEKGVLDTGEIVGETINIGEKGGDSQQWSIYNKAMEQKSSNLENWVRSELRLFGKKANEVAKLIVSREPLENLFFQLINVHYRFVLPSKKTNDKNRWRRPNVKWWDDYLGTQAKTKLEVERKKRTLKNTVEFIDKQAARSLAKVFGAIEMAWGQEVATEKLLELLEKGSHKLTENDIKEMQQFAIEQNSSSDWGQKY